MERNVNDAALKYAGRGWNVIPLFGTDGSKCECGPKNCSSPGKHPRIGQWRDAGTTDPTGISGWWSKWPNSNIGIVTGKASGIVVVDVDGDNGDAAFRHLCANHNFVPETLTVSTGRGRHHYFAHPGVQVPNSAGAIADGVDVRGDGGYIVAPPSVHRSGAIYKWAAEDQALQQIPDWLLQRMLSGKRKPKKVAAQSSETIAEGRRNTTLTSIAGGLRKRGLDEPDILEALLKENDYRCRPPLDPAEVRLIARSISNYAPGTSPALTTAVPARKGGEAMADRLVRLGSNASLFHDTDHQVYASVIRSGSTDNWPLGSTDFEHWLTHEFWVETQSAPSSNAIRDALGVLASKAKFAGETHPVFTRVAEHNGAIYLDLADNERQVVEITPAGWNVISEPPVKFLRPKGMRPLPIPVRGGKLDELRPFLNIAGEEDWMMLIAWLLATFRPHGPYPLAVLHGEQGSAKTTTARVLRAIIDPNMAPVRCEPRDGRDLMITATNGWVIVLDNLSRVSESLSDALCRLSTGGGFASRSLYTNAEETILNAQRPVVLTGIEDLATRGDLLDRSLVIYLPRIRASERRTERKFWESFAATLPRVLGALLTAVAGALAELPRVDLDQLPRLADFATWVTAAEPSLGWDHGTFLKAFLVNRHQANAVALEASLLAGPILKLVESGVWSGTAEQLLRRLNSMAEDDTKRHRDWPQSARAMSGALKRLSPCLLPIGVRISFERANTRDRTRLITIVRSVPSGSSAPSSAAVANTQHE